MSAQVTNTIMMVRPANFGYNAETAENNAFQVNDASRSIDEIKEMAMAEFDTMAAKLKAVGVQVIVVEDTADPVKIDAVFPNNWISTHADGSVVLYPMYSPNRRLERRDDIVELLSDQYAVASVSDYLDYEARGSYVEGTGSMILDRPNRKIYVCTSERSHVDLLERIAQDLDYELYSFEATDGEGTPYYHTNVIMAIGTDVVVLCTESIEDEAERKRVISSLEADGKTLIDITRDQVLQFAGNMLEVVGAKDKHFLVMSSSAYHSLTPSQINKIEGNLSILHTDLTVIETYGGGSARCMMAEVFLDKKS